jgi:hypothetical protein
MRDLLQRFGADSEKRAFSRRDLAETPSSKRRRRGRGRAGAWHTDAMASGYDAVKWIARRQQPSWLQVIRDCHDTLVPQAAEGSVDWIDVGEESNRPADSCADAT